MGSRCCPVRRAVGSRPFLRQLVVNGEAAGLRNWVYVDAAGRTAGEVTVALALELFGAAGSPAMVRERLRVQRPVVVLDSLDEAVDAFTVLTDAVATLADNWSVPGFSLVLGVRGTLAPGDQDAQTLPATATRLLRGTRLQSDQPPYWSPDDLTGYVRHRLRGNDQRRTAYSGRPELIDAFAGAVVELSGTSFVIGELAAAALAADEIPRDPGDPQWRASVVAGLSDVLAAELVREFGDPADRRRATIILQAAALSLGQGVPWRTVWPTMASALAPDETRYGNGDIDWLLRSRAGGYLTAQLSDGVTVYRPFHDSVRAALAFPADDPAIVGITAVDRNDPGPGSRAGQYMTAAHSRITAALEAELRRLPGGFPPDDYLRRRLPGHAVAGDRLDWLLQSPAFLAQVDPDALLPALRHARASAPVAHRYLAHGHQLRAAPTTAGRASVLELAARRDGDAVAAGALAATFPKRPWRTDWSRGFAGQSPHLVLSDTASPVTGVRLDPDADGRLTVFSGAGPAVRVGDTTGNRLREVASGDDFPVTAIDVIRLRGGNSQLVTGHGDGAVRFWEAASGRLLFDLDGHDGPVTAITTGRHSDGHRVALTADRSGRLRQWAAGVQPALEAEWMVGADLVDVVAGSLQDDTPVAVLAFADRIQIHHLHAGLVVLGDALAPVSGIDRITALTYARLAGGRRAAVYGDDQGRVGIWDLTTRSPLNPPLSMSSTGSSVTTLAVGGFSDGRRIVVAGCQDGSVRLGDLNSFTLIGPPLIGHAGAVSSAAATDRGAEWPVIVTGGADGTLRNWDVSAETTSESAPDSVDADPGRTDGQTRAHALTAVAARNGVVVIGDAAGQLAWNNASDGTDLARWPAGGAGISALTIGDIPDHEGVLAVGAVDGSVRLLDRSGFEFWSLSLGGGPIRAVCFAAADPAETYLVSAAPGGITVIDVASGQYAVLADDLEPTALAVGHDLHQRVVLCAGAADGSLHSWDVAHWSPIASAAASTGPGRSVVSLIITAVSDAATVAVAGDPAGRLRRWDMVSGAVSGMVELGAPVSALTDVGVPGCLLIGRRDGLLVPFDLYAGRPLSEAISLDAPVVALCRTGSDFVAGTRGELARLSAATFDSRRR